MSTPNSTKPPVPCIDSVPAPLRDVLELFTGELRGVAFPGVDAALLARHAEEVRDRARDVERAQTALDAALAELGERTAALSALASRGLAYARIYAADDPALAARLDEIALGDRPPTTDACGPRPALRRRRRGPERPELPLGEMAPADELADARPAGDAQPRDRNPAIDER